MGRKGAGAGVGGAGCMPRTAALPPQLALLPFAQLSPCPILLQSPFPSARSARPSCRWWTLAEEARQEWEPEAHPLPSDCRYREDLALLAAGGRLLLGHRSACVHVCVIIVPIGCFCWCRLPLPSTLPKLLPTVTTAGTAAGRRRRCRR